MISFNKIVNKLCKKCGNTVFLTEVFDIIDPEKQEKNKNKLNKTIYRLKSEKILIPIKNGLYIVPDSEDLELNSVDLIDKYYLKILKKYITKELGSSYYISGKKSLEFNMKDYSIPEKIFITNRSINKKVKLGSYDIVFKTISGKKEGKNINLYNILKKHTLDLSIDSNNFKVANLELSILEASIIGESMGGIEISLLNKAIKKYSKVLKREVFSEIAEYKYITSLNRIKELSKNIDRDFYLFILDLIKSNGNLFIGEGIRGF